MRNIVLLAAGIGQRLLPKTQDIPKVMLPLSDGSPLIQRTLDDLVAESGVETIVVVGGYQYAQLERLISSRYQTKVRTVFNSRYDRLGPLYSLWCGLSQLGGDSLGVMNADTYFQPSIISYFSEVCSSATDEAVLFASETQHLGADDVQVLLDGDMRLRAVGKALTEEQVGWRSAGVFYVIGALAAKLLRAFVEDAALMPSNTIWHEALNHLCASGITIRIIDIPDPAWYEIDDITDFAWVSSLSKKKNPSGSQPHS